jgi:hypothetical protein
MLSDSRLVQISKPVAEDFMQVFEHLGNIGLGVWHWGLRFDGRLVGVVSYGTTCFSPKQGWLGHIAFKAGCGIVQLCRGASRTWSPKNTASRLISLANREMYQLKGPTMIVAYANQELKEIGTIYQACNAIYTGLTNPKGQANYIINGRRLTGWQVRKLYGTRDRSKLLSIDPKHYVLPLARKHRYLMLAAPPQKRRLLRKLLTPYSLPYPKRNEKDNASNCPTKGVSEMEIASF